MITLTKLDFSWLTQTMPISLRKPLTKIINKMMTITVITICGNCIALIQQQLGNSPTQLRKIDRFL
jgi:hypothetical protein